MSKQVECPICHEMVDSRGISGHLRFKHGKDNDKVEKLKEKVIEKEEVMPEEMNKINEVVMKEVRDMEEKVDNTQVCICPNCGEEIREGVSYCQSCGVLLSWEEEDE